MVIQVKIHLVIIIRNKTILKKNNNNNNDVSFINATQSKNKVLRLTSICYLWRLFKKKAHNVGHSLLSNTHQLINNEMHCQLVDLFPQTHFRTTQRGRRWSLTTLICSLFFFIPHYTRNNVTFSNLSVSNNALTMRANNEILPVVCEQPGNFKLANACPSSGMILNRSSRKVNVMAMKTAYKR